MKNIFDFTGQGKADAVVPMLLGHMNSKYLSPEPGAALGAQNLWIPEDRRSRYTEWEAVWGLYKWTAPRCVRPYIVEAWGLRSLAMHDFCGGSVVASFGTWAYEPGDDFDYGPVSYTNKGVRAFAQMSSFDDYQWLPDIANAFADPETVTRTDVNNMMLRSLVFWMLGRGYYSNKVGLTAFDRTDGTVTEAFSLANTLRFIPSDIVPYSYSNTASPLHQAEIRPDTHVADWYRAPDEDEMSEEEYGSGTALRCDPTGGPAADFVNRNSGRACHLLFMTPNAGTRARAVPEGGTEYDGDRSVQMVFPAWWADVARTNRYDRIFPRTVFTH